MEVTFAQERRFAQKGGSQPASQGASQPAKASSGGDSINDRFPSLTGNRSVVPTIGTPSTRARLASADPEFLAIVIFSLRYFNFHQFILSPRSVYTMALLYGIRKTIGSYKVS
ncbi:hypothetical protein PCANC_27855 [Puccinia coronata f. sp. avenae]|uniref:Uncharacterized protein n=1 Tax=Puccinia coronata f. sp. avenae TaxID=200324 RepID=A0A2N5TQE3_9BASI|nr:hypothetical protein PCANC_27855 [Puccinia coronata f. sp. avenae]